MIARITSISVFTCGRLWSTNFYFRELLASVWSRGIYFRKIDLNSLKLILRKFLVSKISSITVLETWVIVKRLHCLVYVLSLSYNRCEHGNHVTDPYDGCNNMRPYCSLEQSHCQYDTTRVLYDLATRGGYHHYDYSHPTPLHYH